MQINDTSRINSFFTVDRKATPGLPATSSQFDPTGITLATAYNQAAGLGEALSEFDSLVSEAQLLRNRAARARSTERLELAGGVLSGTTLRSTEEINATPTSFTPFGPDWIPPATSDALAAIDGLYDGSNGTGTLTFEARKSGDHGDKDLEFRVYDPSGSKIETIDVDKSDPLDQEYLLENGLIFTLGAGFVEDEDVFTIEVFDSFGSVVDPDKPFDGLRENNPNLEYGLSVVGGAGRSFDINGVNIAVNASDSINDVLSRITASAAGVNAVFDAATETVLLTQTTPGPTYDISIANDTSGFIQATKLDLAVAVPGVDTGFSNSTAVSKNPQFSTVTSGILRINNTDIAIDITADSLDDILDRINASDAAVISGIRNGRVFLQAQGTKNLLTLDDGGTGFFDALSIQPGLYRPRIRDGVSAEQAEKIAAAAVKIESGMNRLLDNLDAGAQASAQIASLKGQLQGVLGAAESGLSPELSTSLGLKIEADGSGFELDLSAFLNSLGKTFSDVEEVFIGETGNAGQGFVQELLRVVNQFTADLRGQFGITGFLTNLYV